MGVTELLESGMVPPRPAPQLQSGSTSGGKIALVMGREDLGLLPEELARCDAICSLPMGRLQESHSLTHALTIALSRIFEWRQAQMSPADRAAYNFVRTGADSHGDDHEDSD